MQSLSHIAYTNQSFDADDSAGGATPLSTSSLSTEPASYTSIPGGSTVIVRIREHQPSMRYPLPPSAYDVVDLGVYKAVEGNNDLYYQTLPSGYKKEINGYLIEPLVYQPTPQGLRLLVDEFNEQTQSCNLSLFDSTGCVEDPNKNVDRVIAYLNSEDYKGLDTHEGPKAVILSHGQFHALPLFFANDGKQRYMFILDSSAASRYRGFIRVANQFPDLKVGLNKGTRQADGQSCITDAVEVCMRSLHHEEMASVLIQNYREHEEMPKPKGTDQLGLRVNRFAPKIEHGNFGLFRVPAKLAVTSQRSAFLKENEVQTDAMVDRAGTMTFEAFRAPFYERAIISGVSSPATDICAYLSRVSAYHAMIIDRRADHLGR